ncbi:MAG: restriction endonuclease [Dehalococcoidia bacterium]|nr:restriction endonuclease [Dehalococcoidia bacterium]
MASNSRMPASQNPIEPTFVALKQLGGNGSINEIIEIVTANLRLPPEILAIPRCNSTWTEFEFRLANARTYLKSAGLIDNPQRGVWVLIEEATQTERINPKEILESYHLNRTGKNKSDPTKNLSDSIESVAEESEEIAAETAVWRAQLLEILLSIKPDAFERLCQRVLRESGFIEVVVTGRSGDGGIDGRGIVRVAGLISFNVLFQSKRHRGNIGADVVRDFRGAMIGRADKGLIITTGNFTREARREATRDGAPPIDLIDGNLLTDKLRELKLGVNTKLVQAIEIDSSWFEHV